MCECVCVCEGIYAWVCVRSVEKSISKKSDFYGVWEILDHTQVIKQEFWEALGGL